MNAEGVQAEMNAYFTQDDIGEGVRPAGVRFTPTEEELIKDYLRKMLRGEELPSQDIIPVDLYKFHPYELYQKYVEPNAFECYFFTPRDPYTRPQKRTTEQGCWNYHGNKKAILDGMGAEIGFRRTFVFLQGKPGNRTKTMWLMHEYTIPETEKRMMLDNWAVCKIFHKEIMVAAKKYEREQSKRLKQLQQVDHQESLYFTSPMACHQPNPLEDKFLTTMDPDLFTLGAVNGGPLMVDQGEHLNDAVNEAGFPWLREEEVADTLRDLMYNPTDDFNNTPPSQADFTNVDKNVENVKSVEDPQ